MFSSRLPARLSANAFAAALAEARQQGAPLLDLTVTNPTLVGLPIPPELLRPLADPRGCVYDPVPFGDVRARAAIAADPARVVLTASTSEAYSMLFKLLCNPGDRVLIPEPSYPLFALLTGLDGVATSPYRLEYHGVWSIDRDTLERAVTPDTRAILVVSPNNPTGSMLRRADRDWLVDVAGRHDLALIADEVFCDYPLVPAADAVSLAGESRVLTFTLGGLSKSVGLPQLKLGWMVVSGPDGLVAPALERLEVICDTYLSVSTPVQLAAESLMIAGDAIRRSIQARLAVNYQALEDIVSRHPSLRVLPPEGGWSAVVRVPATMGEEALVLRLLQEARVIVHPGYFFDMVEGAHVVVSLLPEPSVFREAMARVAEVAA